eukprot:321715_1
MCYTHSKIMIPTVKQCLRKFNNTPNVKVTVGVDVDEVLCPFAAQLCKFHREQKGSIIQTCDIFDYRFLYRDMLLKSGNKQESRELKKEFLESKYFNEMPVIENSYEMLFELKRNFNFSVITSRTNSLKTQTCEWINEHFQDIFDDILFGNHFSDYNDTGKSFTKSELLQQVNGRVLIDDNLDYCIEAANNIDMVILFGKYAWNMNNNDHGLPSNIYRANDWSEVKDLLLSNYLLDN